MTQPTRNYATLDLVFVSSPRDIKTVHVLDKIIYHNIAFIETRLPIEYRVTAPKVIYDYSKINENALVASF